MFSIDLFSTPLIVTTNLSDSNELRKILNVMFLPITNSSFSVSITIVELDFSFTINVVDLGVAALYNSLPS